MFLWAMGPWFKHREHLSFSCVDNLAGAWCITDSLMLSFRSAGVLFGIFTQLCMSAWKSFTLLCGSILSLRLTGSKVLCQTNCHLVYFQHCWKMYERRFRRGYVSPPMSGELKSTGWNDQGLTRLDLSLVLLMEGVQRFLKGMQFAQGHLWKEQKGIRKMHIVWSLASLDVDWTPDIWDRLASDHRTGGGGILMCDLQTGKLFIQILSRWELLSR